MNKKKRPGIEKAMAFLAAHGTLSASVPKRPPIRTLARGAGVSFVTMWKAVRAVQESGGTAGALPAPPATSLPKMSHRHKPVIYCGARSTFA